MSGRCYAVIGTGAVGGFYGARLQASGADVHFLLRSDYHHVVRRGLTILSKDGDFRLHPVNAYASAEEMPKCTVALVALKTTANHILPSILPQILQPGGTVVLLQNGFGQEDAVATIPQVGEIMAGLCFICASKSAPGQILHLDYGRVRFAVYQGNKGDGELSPTAKGVVDDFVRAGIDAAMEQDLVSARWKKLIWNIPFSGLAVALNRDTAGIVNDPVSRARARTMMEELVRAARALGRTIETSFVDRMIADTQKMRPYLPSMKLDWDARREMELESLYGAPLRRAQAAGATMPTVEELYRELLTMQAERTLER